MVSPEMRRLEAERQAAADFHKAIWRIFVLWYGVVGSPLIVSAWVAFAIWGGNGG